MDKDIETSLLKKAEWTDPAIVDTLVKSAVSILDFTIATSYRLKTELRKNGDIAYVRWVVEDNNITYVLTSLDDFDSIPTKALCKKLGVMNTYQYGEMLQESLSLHQLLLRATAIELVFKKTRSMLVLKSRFGRINSIVHDIPEELIDNDYLTALNRRDITKTNDMKKEVLCFNRIHRIELPKIKIFHIDDGMKFY